MTDSSSDILFKTVQNLQTFYQQQPNNLPAMRKEVVQCLADFFGNSQMILCSQVPFFELSEDSFIQQMQVSSPKATAFVLQHKDFLQKLFTQSFQQSYTPLAWSPCEEAEKKGLPTQSLLLAPICVAQECFAIILLLSSEPFEAKALENIRLLLPTISIVLYKPLPQFPMHEQVSFPELLNSLPDAVWSMDIAKARYHYLSAACESVFGYTVEELQNFSVEDWQKIILPEDYPLVEAAWEKVMQEGYAQVEFRIRHQDGTMRYLFDKYQLVRNEDGVLRRVNGITRDITKRKTERLLLEAALQREQELNEELSQREEELSASEEEIRQHLQETSRYNEFLEQTRTVLKSSEEKYRYLFEHSPVPMWIYERQSLRFLAVNQAVVNLYGYTEAEFLQMTLKDIRSEEARQEFERFIQQQSGSNPLLQSTGYWEHQRKDGTKITVEVVVSEILLEGQEANLTLVLDVSEKVNSQRQLIESEAQFRSMFDASVQAYCLIDQDYRLLKVNKVTKVLAQKYFKKELQEGDSFLEYVFGERVEVFKENFARALQGESIFLEKNISLHGQDIFFEIQYLPIYGVDKKINSIAFVYRDVSAQRQNEILLQKHYRSSKNFRNALNRSAVISITDLEGTILDVNRAFCQLSKFSKHEVIGKKHSIVSAEIHDAAFFEEMWVKLKSGKSWRGEICNRAKDDTLYWLEMIINPIQDESGKVYQYLAVSYPISQRKKAEKEKQELLERLAHYAFMNSHNLRRPLANILGLVSLFNSEDADFDQKIIEKLRISALELDKIIHTMNDLLRSNELKNIDSFSAPKRSSSS